MSNEEQKKLGQNPAFPIIDSNSNLAAFNAGLDPSGMSKRFYLASLAMQSLLSNPSIARPQSFSDIEGYREFAKVCYSYADSILEQESAE